MTTSVCPSLRASVAGCVLLLAVAGGAEAHARHQGGGANGPVVVELYTAQGCSTCAKGNGVISDLSNRKGLIPITFSVDLWDYLGWSDTLSKPEFTTRQRAYAERLKVREIYTPEIVVQGEGEGLASDRAKINDLIAKAQAEHRDGPHIRFLRHASRVSVSGQGAGEVWLVRYDPDPQTVKVKAGDTKGQIVTVKNAVRALKKLGTWRGGTKAYALPKENEDLKTVVIVQGFKGGRILAAARG